MPSIRQPLTFLVAGQRDPVVVQGVRSTLAAVLAYVVALQVVPNPTPLLAPLTALLVVQVTVFATLTTGFRRVVSVVAGVMVAVGFSALVGLSWWSLGIIIAASLVFGHLLRVEEFVAEVAISGMLVLGVRNVHGEALDRILETLIGASVGMVLNVVLAPPVWVQPASAAVENLAAKMRALLLKIGAELEQQASHQHAWDWLHEARRLDNEIGRVDEDLTRAEESTRFNPRVRGGEQARIILRSGLDTLEICAVVLRTLCRSLADLAQTREAGEGVYGGELPSLLRALLTHLAAAVHGFARLITAQVTAGAEQAEKDLSAALSAGRRDRELIAVCLARETWESSEWQLHGSLLATIDRLIDELDVEKRSQMLMGHFTRHAQRHRPSRAAVERMRRQLRRHWK